MHIDGVLKNPHTFEHISPDAVGNSRSFVISDLAGRNSLMGRIHSVDPTVEKDSPSSNISSTSSSKWSLKAISSRMRTIRLR